MTILSELSNKGLIQMPKFLNDNTHYLTMMGSVVYGASDDTSDRDVYGLCVPPKDMVFPHLAGEIHGFGNQIKRFEVWQQHHVKDGAYEWDFSVYSIVKYFQLLMENNPNMLDSMATPRNAVLHITPLAQHVRDNWGIFVHKGCYGKFRGYAMSQMAKIKSKVVPTNPKRAKLVELYGYDTKYAFHLCRLILEAEQLLETGTMNLSKDSALYRKIRAGEWSLEYMIEWFAEKEKHLEQLLNKSTIPYGPDEDVIKSLLLECLEMHYGSISDAIKIEVPVDKMIREIQSVIDKYK